MDILAHRGIWSTPREQNTLAAFRRALDGGFGIELDIRDRGGKPVIAHDPAGSAAPLLDHVFLSLSGHPRFRSVRYALNVKSDGLAGGLARVVAKFRLTRRCFAFDMSVPQMDVYLRTCRGVIPLASRQSDIEEPVFFQESPWVWLDELRDSWITAAVIAKLVRRGKMVAVVSPELHGRPYHAAWRRYRTLPAGTLDSVALCTDRAIEASVFFVGKRA